MLRSRVHAIYSGEKKLLQPDLIAVEPVHGWHGAQVNQSKVALEWLYFEGSKLDGDNEIKFV